MYFRCKELGLIERCVHIPCRQATNEELRMKHSQEIIDLLKSTTDSLDYENLEDLSSKFNAIYIHPVSFKEKKFFNFLAHYWCSI